MTSRTASRGPTLATVLLFPDTFANYYEPDLGVAAVELLSRGAGCDVTLGPAPTSAAAAGRMISNGLLDQAVAQRPAQCRRALHDWAAPGRPIVACEPSCLLTIKDDYPALLRGESAARAEAVAGACLTFEEFLGSILADAEADGRPALTFRAGPATDPRAGPLPSALARRHGAAAASCCGASPGPR